LNGQNREELLKDGSVRWRARGVSTGKDPMTGKRTQRTITGKTRKEVKAEVARITGKVADRTYTPNSAQLAESSG
jgi:hypothetical protein